MIGPTDAGLGDILPAVIDLIAFGQPGRLFGAERRLVGRQHHRISQQIIHVTRAAATRKAQPIHLNGRGTEGEDFRPGEVGVRHQVHENMDAVFLDPPHGGGVFHAGQIDELIAVVPDLPIIGAAVVAEQGVGVNLEAAAIMSAEQRAHQMSRRMLAKIRRDIADFQARLVPEQRPLPDPLPPVAARPATVSTIHSASRQAMANRNAGDRGRNSARKGNNGERSPRARHSSVSCRIAATRLS